MKTKLLKTYDWSGQRIYADIQSSTVIRDGRAAMVELWHDDYEKKRRLVIPNKLAAQKMVAELQRLIDKWPEGQ